MYCLSLHPRVRLSLSYMSFIFYTPLSVTILSNTQRNLHFDLHPRSFRNRSGGELGFFGRGPDVMGGLSGACKRQE